MSDCNSSNPRVRARSRCASTSRRIRSSTLTNDHFEGRSLPGWQRHVVLTALAYAWLQHERRRNPARLPTLPVARAVFTEILTAHFFVTQPGYLETMLKFKEIALRI